MYADFRPELNNFFEMAKALPEMSKKPIPGLELPGLSSLLEDNAYFLEKGFVNKTYQIGNYL